MSKKPSKSESLTIRLDPKTRFMLEFLSRIKGQTITTVVERAISEASSRQTVLVEATFSLDLEKKTWRDYWSVSEAERALNMAQLPDVHPTYEEERRLDFAKRWWHFFFTTPMCSKVDRQYADILWPNIDRYLEIEEENRSANAFAAGFAMERGLKEANIMAPQWMPDNIEIPF